MSVTLEAKPQVRGEQFEFFKYLAEYSGPMKVIEAVIHGPRGTGKSFGDIRFLHTIATVKPGAKILVVRKTRHSLSESFCKSFEEDAILPTTRTVICGDADRTNRSHYQYPNGSRIVLVGLDKPSKHQSTDWDIVYVEEASEVPWKQVEPFAGALRQFTPGMKWQLLLMATNPDSPRSYLYQRMHNGKAMNVATTHKDNPKWWSEDLNDWTPEGAAFMESLRARYTGVQFDRHVLGIWRGIEGMVWESFDEAVHVIDAPRRSDDTPEWKTLGLKGFIAGMDWGHTAPGSLSVYGRDGDKRLVKVAQVYRTKQQLEWWAQRVVEFDEEFGLDRVMCDPSRPDAIELVNDWLSKRGKPRICEPAENKKASSAGGDLAGIDLVRWGFEKDETGTSRIRFVRDALRYGVDAELVATGAPTCTEEEIPSYAFARDSQGELIHDRTDPDAADHGCDELRYVCAENWKRGAPKDPLVPVFKPRSIGQVYRHAEEFKAPRRHRAMWRSGVV